MLPGLVAIVMLAFGYKYRGNVPFLIHMLSGQEGAMGQGSTLDLLNKKMLYFSTTRIQEIFTYYMCPLDKYYPVLVYLSNKMVLSPLPGIWYRY